MIKVDALTNSLLFESSPANQTPITGARISGPLPAENTPLVAGLKPSQSYTNARAVANPMPAGTEASHQRNRHARAEANF